MYQASPEDKASVLCFPSLLEQGFFLLAHKGSGFAFLLNKYCANRYSVPRFLSHDSSLWWPHLYNSQFIQHSIQGVEPPAHDSLFGCEGPALLSQLHWALP